MRHISVAVLLLILPLCPLRETHAQPSFPGALGFGAAATGGQGGTVVHVTTLNDSGPGSFREAVSRPKRTIIFDVGGTVALKSPVSIAGDITVDGETAPSDGITLSGYEVSCSRSRNVILRALRIRQGLTRGQEHKYALGLRDTHTIIIDHCSIEWGRWDCIGMSKSSDITVQDCIIGEGVDPQRFGCLCESDNVTFVRNLWINNQSRNPKGKGHIQYVNNVVYNWGVTGYVGGHSAAKHAADLVNNVFIKGPSSSDRFVGEFAVTDHIYQSGNIVDLNRNGQLDGRPVTAADFAGCTLVPTPWVTPLLSAEPALTAFCRVLADAGCSRHRDATDARLIAQVASLGTRGEIVHAPPATTDGEQR